MLHSSFSRLLSISPQFKNLYRNIVNADSKLERLWFHVYRKTWTKAQLIEYIKENVVFESDKYIVTSLPQGIALKKTSQWTDTVTPLTSEADLKEIMKELPATFNTESVFLTIYPRCNTSGLTIFAKNYSDKAYFISNLNRAVSNNEYSYNFLAVVLGCPEKNLTQTFGVRSNKNGDKYYTEILQIRKENKNSKEIRKVHYRHKVLASTHLASLVKIELSQDVRDCVRHILGTQCLTPVLGDVWNCVKQDSSFLGSPLAMNPNVIDTSSLSLNPELLAKLNLQPGEEAIIPIHVHLHSLRVGMKNNQELFFSVPPPESFTWTCNQLEFKDIKYFQKAE